jgi:exopolyphosphatase/guanosine-5'-triphosphate,3'-diphosphate pyrophosphatase
VNEDTERAAVALVAADYPQGAEHALQVTRLALMLFDQTEPLHHLKNRERFLLEYTGILHDIGWIYGQKGHHSRSARMIAGDERLPFDLRERAIISLVALSHRKNARLQGNGLFSVLPETDRRIIWVLGSILRVADGLDYLHLSTVLEVDCHIHPGEIICEIATSGDASVEKARALSKADMFEQVFGRPLVIR